MATSDETRVLDELYTAIESHNRLQVETILKTNRKCLKLNQALSGEKMTVLHFAVGSNSFEIVQLLLKYGADPNNQDCEGKLTPLMLSVLYDFELIVGILVEAGGNPLIRDAENKNCLDYVIENDLTHLLIQLTTIVKNDPLSRLSRLSQSPVQENQVTRTETDDSFFTCSNVTTASIESKPPCRSASSIQVIPFVPSTSSTSVQGKPFGASTSSPSVPVGPFGASPSFRVRPFGASTSSPSVRVGNFGASTCSTQKRARPFEGTAPSGPPPSGSAPSGPAPPGPAPPGPAPPGPAPPGAALPGFALSTSASSTSSSSVFSFSASSTSDEASSSYNSGKGISDYSYLLTDDETRYGTIEEISSTQSKIATYRETFFPHTCSPSASNTGEIPTLEAIQRLREKINKLGLELPVTESTYAVLSRFIAYRPTDIGTGHCPRIDIRYNEPIYPKNKPESGFSTELMYALRNMDVILTWGSNHRVDMLREFQSHNSDASPSKRVSRAYFNYLLLDPQIIKRANFSGNQLKSDTITKNSEKFETFLRSVFYIGKGCGSRPLQHLVEAKQKLVLKKKNVASSDKLDKVLEIWNSGQGVIVHSVFHHSTEKEANSNEAAMIDAIGLNYESLTNLKKGSYEGTIASGWSQKVKNQYGTFQLYKAFCTFVVDEPKKFLPHDV